MLNKIDGNILFDFYGPLLTDHQNEVLNDYYYDDLSMSEIADNYNVSKSAISDLINRSILQMNEYEEKLHLIKNSKSIDTLIDKMDKDLNVPKKYIKELKKLNRG